PSRRSSALLEALHYLAAACPQTINVPLPNKKHHLSENSSRQCHLSHQRNDCSCEREVRLMAVAEKISSQLRLTFYDGEDTSTGDAIYKSKNFNNVKTEATADKLYAIAQAMSGLQERPLYTIERKDTSDVQEG